jgi:hypothetical protein
LDHPDFVAADMKLRRVAVLTMLAATVIATAMVGWFVPWLAAAIQQAQLSGTLSVPLACYLFLAVVAVLAAPVVGFGVFAMRSGRLVIVSKQYPPPGMRVLRRTRILRGSAARLTGQGQFVLGLLLVLCGIALFGVACWGAWLIGWAGPTRVTARPSAPPAAVASTALGRSGLPAEPISTASVVFMEASSAEIDEARAGASADEFAVIADDLMFYRASAHEQLAALGTPPVRVSGRRPLEFVVAGEPKLYDFAGAAPLDLIVVYLPDHEPRTFATLEVDQAIGYFRSGAPH